MSHSHKIHDDMPNSPDVEEKDAVQNAEFGASNLSGEGEESLRGRNDEEAPAPEGTDDVQSEISGGDGEESAEPEKPEEGVAEAAEALRALHDLESVLKDAASAGRSSHEREIPSVLPVFQFTSSIMPCIIIDNSLILLNNKLCC